MESTSRRNRKKIVEMTTIFSSSSGWEKKKD
jgi:hypothetical protein